jgi:hypothetical protein
VNHLSPHFSPGFCGGGSGHVDCVALPWAPCIHARLRRLAAKLGEESGFAESEQNDQASVTAQLTSRPQAKPCLTTWECRPWWPAEEEKGTARTVRCPSGTAGPEVERKRRFLVVGVQTDAPGSESREKRIIRAAVKPFVGLRAWRLGLYLARTRWLAGTRWWSLFV